MVKLITFQLPLRLYIENTILLMITDWEMGVDNGHWATGNAHCLRKVFGLLPTEAYCLESCAACIASYTVSIGWTMGYCLTQGGLTGLIALHNVHLHRIQSGRPRSLYTDRCRVSKSNVSCSKILLNDYFRFLNQCPPGKVNKVGAKVRDSFIDGDGPGETGPRM